MVLYVSYIIYLICPQKLQNDTGVFFVPGKAFNKEYHLRFGFTSDSKVIKEGLETFSSWIHSHITEAE